ncbi:MAG: hypothetical protein ACREND_17420, partial [Gemmatimonadaceae bacterium]
MANEIIDSHATILITEAHENGRLGIPDAIALAERVPGLDVVVYGDFAGRQAPAVMRHLPTVVSAVLSLDVDDSPSQIRSLLMKSLGQRRAAQSMESVRDVLSAAAFNIFSVVLENSMRPMTPDGLSRMLSRTPRSLNRLFHRLYLLPPARVIAWCRAIHALRLIEVGCSVEGVARFMDFSSG